MLRCKDRRSTIYGNGYCSRDGKDCGTRWLWCKGIIVGILAAITIAYFSYGVVYAWQKAEDRIMMQEIRQEQKRIAERMDYLDGRIKATDKTIIYYWKKYGRGR